MCHVFNAMHDTSIAEDLFRKQSSQSSQAQVLAGFGNTGSGNSGSGNLGSGNSGFGNTGFGIGQEQVSTAAGVYT